MITSYMYTNVGGRKVNEDSCITLEDGKEKCYVLCDGLGGHGKGEVASGIVTEVFDQCYHAGVSKPDQFIADTLMVAQVILCGASSAFCSGILVIALLPSSRIGNIYERVGRTMPDYFSFSGKAMKQLSCVFGERFCSKARFENAGILYVFRIFKPQNWGKRSGEDRRRLIQRFWKERTKWTYIRSEWS